MKTQIFCFEISLLIFEFLPNLKTSVLLVTNIKMFTKFRRRLVNRSRALRSMTGTLGVSAGEGFTTFHSIMSHIPNGNYEYQSKQTIKLTSPPITRINNQQNTSKTERKIPNFGGSVQVGQEVKKIKHSHITELITQRKGT